MKKGSDEREGKEKMEGIKDILKRTERGKEGIEGEKEGERKIEKN